MYDKAKLEEMRNDAVIAGLNAYDYSNRWTRRDDIICFTLMLIFFAFVVGAAV